MFQSEFGMFVRIDLGHILGFGRGSRNGVQRLDICSGDIPRSLNRRFRKSDFLMNKIIVGLGLRASLGRW